MAGGGGGDSKARELDQTPTWAVASVCAVIIVISIILEKVLHLVGEVSLPRLQSPTKTIDIYIVITLDNPSLKFFFDVL